MNTSCCPYSTNFIEFVSWSFSSNYFRVCWVDGNINLRATFPQSEALNMNDLMANMPPESIFSPPPSNALIPHLGDPDALEGLARWKDRRCRSKRRTCKKSEVCVGFNDRYFG